MLVDPHEAVRTSCDYEKLMVVGDFYPSPTIGSIAHCDILIESKTCAIVLVDISLSGSNHKGHVHVIIGDAD